MTWLTILWLGSSPAQAQFFPGQGGFPGGGFPGGGFPGGGMPPGGNQPDSGGNLPGGGPQWGDVDFRDDSDLPPCEEADTSIIDCYPSGLKGAATLADEPGGCIRTADRSGGLGALGVMVGLALVRRSRDEEAPSGISDRS